MKITIDDDMYANEMVNIELTDEEATAIVNLVKNPEDQLFYPVFGMAVIDLLETIDTPSAFKMEEQLVLIENEIMSFYTNPDDKANAKEQFKLKAESEISTKLLAEVIRKKL